MITELRFLEDEVPARKRDVLGVDGQKGPNHGNNGQQQRGRSAIHKTTGDQSTEQTQQSKSAREQNAKTKTKRVEDLSLS